MTRAECWCRGRNNGEPIRACLLCGGKGYVDTPDPDPDECSICGMRPTTDSAGLVVRHSPQCPRSPSDPPAIDPTPPVVEAPSGSMFDESMEAALEAQASQAIDPVAAAEAPHASGGAVRVTDAEPSVPPEPAERPTAAVEVDEGPGATPGSFERGMAGSARSASGWTDEQKVAVRVAVRYAARMNAEFTTDEVWERLWSIDPDFPVTKGMAGILTSMTEHEYGTEMVGPGAGSGLTKAGRPATMRRTGRTRKPQREDVNNGQRLAVYESLVFDSGLCPRSLAGPVPPEPIERSRAHIAPGDEVLIRCSACMQAVPLAVYAGVPFLSEHRAAVPA